MTAAETTAGAAATTTAGAAATTTAVAAASTTTAAVTTTTAAVDSCNSTNKEKADNKRNLNQLFESRLRDLNSIGSLFFQVVKG